MTPRRRHSFTLMPPTRSVVCGIEQGQNSADHTIQTFCADVDPDDEDTMPNFLTRMAGYIEYHQSNQLGFDDEPRIRPMEGTVVEDIIPDDSADGSVLLQYQSDAESDDQDALDGLLHVTTYWQPANGNIGILPPMYANDISRLTGSSLFAEEAEKRYRIIQGDFNRAHEKLLRLEPLLEIFEKQSGNQSLPATGDLLIWPPNQEDSTMEFVSMGAHLPAYQRVVVNRMEQNLSKKAIGELRQLDLKTREFQIPRNLQKEAMIPTHTFQASKIWDSEIYMSFGDPKNMDPIITSNPTSAGHSDLAPSPDLGGNRIAAWTNTVVRSANPDIAPERPVEPVAPTRRRVAIESDSEDEEPSVPAPKSVPAVTEVAPEAPLVLLSEDEDLMDDESQPAQNAEALPPPLQGSTENILVGLSEEVDVAHAQGGSQGETGIHSALLHEEQEVDLIRASYQEAASGHHESRAIAGASNETADNSPSQSDTHLSSEAMSCRPAEEPAEFENIPSSATDIASITPEIPAASRITRPSFHPDRYGSSTRPVRGQLGQADYRGRTNNRYRGDGRGRRGHNCDHPESQRMTPFEGFRLRGPTGRPRQRGNGRPYAAHLGERPPRARGFQDAGLRSSYGTLVDLRSPETTGGALSVPPGLEYNVPLLPANASCGQTSIETSDLCVRSNMTSPSSGSGLTRLKFSEEGSDYVTTFVPKADQSALREKTIQQIQEAILAMNKKAEEKPPRLHSTMRQQGKNPGKTPAKQETEAARKARIAKAMEDAYPTSTNVPPRSQPASPKPDEMSKWKRSQMKKKSLMAKGHPDLVANDLRTSQTKKLISLLQPVFETGRAFSGKLTFELQFGQVLISPGQQLRDQTYHTVDNWKSYFDSGSASTHTFSSFTEILTSNGADIDRVLEMKGSIGNGTGKLWGHSPGPRSVSYEFHCQSRSNEDFQIVVDQSGRYELRRGLVTVGAINMHVPAQVWDLSATLSGPLKWPDPPETVAQSVSAFVKSLYVLPGRSKLLLVFRQPDDHEIQVRNLVVKRDSYHSNNRLDGQKILLKITEAKNLQFRVHPEDKRLWQGYEGPDQAYKDFADGGHIHYEMSLVHDGINEVLAKNEALEIGELTDAETTGKSLLDHHIIHSMLDSAVQTISRMDFVGMRNYGTQQRLEDKTRKHFEELEALLGPKAQTILQLPNMVRESSQATSRHQLNKSNGASADDATVVQQQQPVPGVRMNTEAQVVIDASGNRYRLGMGGARIPVVDDDKPPGSAETVIPDDSASQAGGTRAPMRSGPAKTERGRGFW
ncbi:uncharacterized protein A1O5_02452 [Cladophialophora psammophila CBS 110553]|uniref:Uncharacterized protein n=1 Tax=Cladophialophora psammophila CBS 110553 TaxID=1182543 RepID=W9X1T1_9EURO|nr:uncharacterized protein A1O5_02452 [Cladophialophora psammophila CBS 110553]EXJ74158.1 hypothetical protein A1O5_02452 [Cladophialophora psammophila CBS 110553]